MTNRRNFIGAACAATTLGSVGMRAGAAAPLRIGQSLPLTGPLSSVVKPIAEGQRALLEEVNAAGGVSGSAIELITLDDAAQPDKTVENTRRLIDNDKVVALFGFAFVPGLVRAMPIVNEKRVPLIGVYNGADVLRAQPNPYLFTTTASLRDEVTQMVRTLATLGTRQLALVYQNNELGRFMLPLVQALAQEHEATLVCTVPAEPDGSNGAAAVQEVVAKQPQAILLLAAGAALMGFMKNLPAQPRVPVYALSLAGTTALLEQLGPAARGMAFTQVVPDPVRATTVLARRFSALMTKAGLPPTYDRMWGFLNATILVEVLRRAGAAPTPAGIASALEHMGDVDLGGYRLAYGPNRRHGSKFVDITMVDQNGRFVR
jgi:ABC-type branched-subunit amino acid transport system substrate-binding protein